MQIIHVLFGQSKHLAKPVFVLSPLASVVSGVWVAAHLLDDGIKVGRWAKQKWNTRRASTQQAAYQGAKAGAAEAQAQPHA